MVKKNNFALAQIDSDATTHFKGKLLKTFHSDICLLTASLES